jgi:Xaa-Pro aminopeptidase
VKSVARDRAPVATTLLALFSLCGAPAAFAQNGGDRFQQGRTIAAMPSVLAQRARPEAINRMLEERLDTLLPELMRETGIDMWLVINREYNEDPVFFTLAPAPVHAARRTTMLLFFDRGPEQGVERLSVNRYPFGRFYEAAWQGGNLDEQWRGLADVIAARDPKRIGINVSRHWPVADGLSAALREQLDEALGPELRKRVVSAEDLAVRWLETRAPLELETYPQIVAIARRVIEEAFSSQVITPGVTTTDDVAWYIAERFAELELDIWFQPSVNAQRAEEPCGADNPFCGRDGDFVIRRGDVLHTDVGICYLRLCTDTQEMGYVLRAGEDDVPAELAAALRTGNRWQDILTGEFRIGRTGNEILAATIAKSESEGIVSSTYTHPLGFFGHAPGPTIGMWDNQGSTPVQGDWKLFPRTVFSIEGNVRVPIQSWGGNPVVIKLEQDAVFEDDGVPVRYLAGRQVEWHLVR